MLACSGRSHLHTIVIGSLPPLRPHGKAKIEVLGGCSQGRLSRRHLGLSMWPDTVWHIKEVEGASAEGRAS